MRLFIALLSSTWLLAASSLGEEPSLFDVPSIRDTSTLEISVLQDWQPSSREPAVLQKLIEVTVCEWWPGQKVRLPVTLNVPADGKPCRRLVVANQPLALKPALPSGGQLDLLKNHGVGIVLIGMGTIDAMAPAGQLHIGMKERLLKTKGARYTPSWIWGMSQMRALTAAETEPDFFQPERVLTTGGSKRGIASAAAGIHDDRFTAIMPVVAPPLGNPAFPSFVIGTEPKQILSANRKWYSDLKSGKIKLPEETYQAMKDRDQRRAQNRVTLKEANAAGWNKDDIQSITDRAWDASRTTSSLKFLQDRGLEIFYNVGTNDSVTPSLLKLGEKFPDFPIYIVPGGQHGGPAYAGFDRRTPTLPEVQQNFVSFALRHFARLPMPKAPKLAYVYDPETRKLTVTAKVSAEQHNGEHRLWWSYDRSLPYTLPFEYDPWESMKMEPLAPGHFEATLKIASDPGTVDFLSVHQQTQGEHPLTVSSRLTRIATD